METALPFLILYVQFGVACAVAALAAGDLARFRGHLRGGLTLGTVYLVLMVIPTIFTIRYVDIDALAEQMGPRAGDEVFRTAVRVGVLLGLALAALKAVWYLVVWHASASQWERLMPASREDRTGGPRSSGIGVGVAFGIVAGAGSAVFVYASDMGMGEPFRKLAELMPDMHLAHPVFRYSAALCTVTLAAVVEEVVFRGALLGALLRGVGESRSGIAFAFAVVSLLWAAMHFPNTDMPVLKVAQVFVIGLFFCGLARRRGIGSAIAGHLGLNWSAVLVGSYLEQMP